MISLTSLLNMNQLIQSLLEFSLTFQGANFQDKITSMSFITSILATFLLNNIKAIFLYQIREKRQ
jgi:hypothetical protein